MKFADCIQLNRFKAMDDEQELVDAATDAYHEDQFMAGEKLVSKYPQNVVVVE